MIIGEVRRYLRDNNTMRVSRSLRDLAYRALRAREALVHRLQRDPSVDEIAKEIDSPREDVVRALDSIQDTVSLYEPVFRDNGDTVFIMDQIKDTKNTDERWMTNISLSEAMSRLNPRERHILSRRFFDGKTQTEVADEIGISQAQNSFLKRRGSSPGFSSDSHPCVPQHTVLSFLLQKHRPQYRDRRPIPAIFSPRRPL